MALIGIEINEIIFTDGVGAAFNCNLSGALGYQYQFMVALSKRFAVYGYGRRQWELRTLSPSDRFQTAAD